MADQIRHRTVTVAAGTAKTAPQETNISFPAARVAWVEIFIPPGHAGFTGIALAQAHQPVIPFDVGEFIVRDDDKIHWDLEGYVDSGNWQAIAYNTDTFQHQFFITFGLEVAHATVAVIGGPVPILGPSDGTDLGSGSVVVVPGTGSGTPAPDEGEPLPGGDDDGAGTGDGEGGGGGDDDTPPEEDIPDIPDVVDIPPEPILVGSETVEDPGPAIVLPPIDDGPETLPGTAAPVTPAAPVAVALPSHPLNTSAPGGGSSPQPTSGEGIFYNEERNLRYIVTRDYSQSQRKTCSYRRYETHLNRGNWYDTTPILIAGTCR